MYNLINKINFYHSIIFFLFSCFIALVVNQFENLIISPMVCLFFILSIGISHGALDNEKGKKLSKLYNIKKSYFFYIIYSLIGIIIIIFWLFFPTVSLILLLVVLRIINKSWKILLLLDRNLIIVSGELSNILKNIFGICLAWLLKTLKNILSRNWYF